MKNKNSLLDADIDKKFAYEERLARNYNEEPSPYKTFDIMAAIFMAAVVISGIVYGLLSIIGAK
ncbi:hypothetical protein ABC426_00160 [Lactiplantibacillus plantarum]|uniref:hypothetical protein n=1 Tax=Lactiplantibacillus plantarum TaxID=1590 RepID=UPI001BABDAFE|nr:hypothetical protein [Lactiplantibacillus plantarum]MBS0953236.1 hypothetical protein [Lactiplantibacillus plantarum]